MTGVTSWISTLMGCSSINHLMKTCVERHVDYRTCTNLKVEVSSCSGFHNNGFVKVVQHDFA